MIKVALITALLFGLGSAVASPVDDFNRLVDEVWQWELQQFPERRTRLGLNQPNDSWTDHSPAAYAKRDARRAEFLAELQTIDSTALEGDEQLTYAMLERRLHETRGAYELGLHLMNMNMRSGPQHRHTIQDQTPFNDAADYADWLARMDSIPDLLAHHTALLKEGMRRQRVQPRDVLIRVPAQLDNVIVANPEDSPYYKPFTTMPQTIDEASAEALRTDAKALIKNRVNPAYRKFKAFFVDEYLPASRTAPGVGSLPGGKDIYRFLARRFTTTDLTPEQIHEIGKQEVARILGEMEVVKEETGFDGNLQAFNDFLRTDPQFYYDSPEALLEGYRAISKRLDPELVKLFRRLPRTPYGVKPIPAETAPDTTTAYYSRPAMDGSRAGWYYVNLYRPEVRPKYEMEVLSVHEAVPGHHLQIALAQELEGLPPIRRQSGVTAFIEGWGLYSERLGYQMGLYADPYSRYGQLTYDMWRAVRLVVDTGIHYFGWERQRAIDYFLAHAGKSEADIINEIDRYIGWPGQALAYKIGQMKMLELRARAEQALGDDFDIRDFHDELLGAGAIPLDALETRMDAWIARESK